MAYTENTICHSLCLSLHAWLRMRNGNCKEVKRVLKKYCKFLGKKRAQGKGGIVSIETEHIDDDWSLVKDGKAMRWLPNDTGFRDVRVKPPYWNLVDRVRCCEVSDPYTL